MTKTEEIDYGKYAELIEYVITNDLATPSSSPAPPAKLPC